MFVFLDLCPVSLARVQAPIGHNKVNQYEFPKSLLCAKHCAIVPSLKKQSGETTYKDVDKINSK